MIQIRVILNLFLTGLVLEMGHDSVLPSRGLKRVVVLNDPDFHVIPKNNEVSYLLEVNLLVDGDLHKKFQNLPFYAESKFPPN